MPPPIVPAAWMRKAAALFALLVLLLLGLSAGPPARAQGVELPTFELKRQDGALTLDMEDEILKAAVVTHGGAVVHEGVKG